MKNIIKNLNPNVLGLAFSVSMILASITYYMYTNDISGSMVLMTVGLSTATMFTMLLFIKADNTSLVSP